jgi:hypothetical protein
VSGQDGVFYRYIGAVTDVDEASIGRTVVFFARNAVFQPSTSTLDRLIAMFRL